MIHKEKTIAELKSFGFVMALVLCSIGGIAVWRGKPIWPLFIVLTAYFVLSAILAPQSLRIVEKKWVAFGEKIGTVMTFVLLSLTYFIVITPTGLLLRLFGKDLLSIKMDPEAKTYWIPADREGTAKRHFLPY